MVLSLAAAFTGCRWAKAAALDESLEDKLIGGGARCKEPYGGARSADDAGMNAERRGWRY
jgi:hypothetical protein